jgi:hypothetical protein
MKVQMHLPMFSRPVGVGIILRGWERQEAFDIIANNHYTRSTPSGKTHAVRYNEAIVLWSIPANKNIGKFLLGVDCNCWELSRLWAPDGHERNLLSQAISAATSIIRAIESPDILVSYADPSAGHSGGVYKAASWVAHGQSEEVRAYKSMDGTIVPRRAFHSGSDGLKKSEIERLGYTQIRSDGKLRFVKPLTRRAKRAILASAHGGQP